MDVLGVYGSFNQVPAHKMDLQLGKLCDVYVYAITNNHATATHRHCCGYATCAALSECERASRS